MLIIFTIIVFILMNRVRGSGGKTLGEYWGFESSYSGSLYASILFSFICYSVSNSFLVAILSLLFYKVGESPGWGKWIGQMHGGIPNPDNDEGKRNGIHWLSNLLFDEVKHTKKYAAVALVLRGMFWFLLAYLPMFLLGVISPSVYISLVVGSGLAFPVSFYASYILGDRHYWERGETIYGALQGIIFILLVL